LERSLRLRDRLNDSRLKRLVSEMPAIPSLPHLYEAYLLGLWGLPDEVVEAVAFHHEPALTLDRQFCPLTAVHAANALCPSPARKAGLTESELDLPYLTRIGLLEHVPQWREQVGKEENHLDASLLPA
jgi:HD-like signal output (HDOD) protein